jgi:hypothetical protein
MFLNDVDFFDDRTGRQLEFDSVKIGLDIHEL